MGDSGEDANSNYSLSEDDGDNNEETYAKLQASVAQLDSSQKIRAAKRNELGSLISEYYVKEKDKTSVAAQELANVLGNKAKELKVQKKLKNVASKSKTLPKPLGKPIVDQIKRKIGYAVVNQQLKSWEPVVESYRVADHIVFPLNAPTFSINNNSNPSQRVNQTPLEKELNAVLHGEREEKVETKEEDEFPLTLDELMERRKELATLRARQSYKEAKAYRQSKIKSKKYHRMQKREKVKQQLKEFEILQKTDPAAALKKLDELEKSRAEERATLRHKSTGKWAKNLTVRAKYDKESRRELAEQLAVSRDITQKVKPNESSDDEGNDDHVNDQNPDILASALSIAESNPWSLEVTPDVNSFISGFKKYWSDKSKPTEETNIEPMNETEEPVIIPAEKKSSVKKANKLKSLKLGSSGTWSVSPVVSDATRLKRKVVGVDIDDAFYVANDKLAKKIAEKFKTLENHVKADPRKLKKRRPSTKPESLLAMKKSRWHIERAQVDQELGNDALMDSKETPKSTQSVLLDSLNTESEKKSVQQNPYDLNIDPDKFMKVKSKKVPTPSGDDMAQGDVDALDDDDERQEKVIMEAFADDNVTDFREAKESEEKLTKPEVVKELPGWGSWGGTGVVATKRRKRRFQLPKLPPRKDKNLNGLIINENANPNVTSHMVKEVPFPFQSVAAFESNIRAPVSRDWVPELAHRDLILPTVITKLGSIIDPMSDNVLLRNRPKARSVFKSKVKNGK